MDSAISLRLDSDTLRNMNRLATADRKFVEDGALVTFTSTVVQLAEQYASERNRLEDSGLDIDNDTIISVDCDRLAATRFIRGCVLLSFHIAQGFNPIIPRDQHDSFSESIMSIARSFNQEFARVQLREMVDFAAQMVTTRRKYNTVDNITFGEFPGISLN